MNDFEADKRDVFLKEKIDKLKNPNFFVSSTSERKYNKQN